ncbi:hypothetical protein Tsubulata_027925 [Turnera subulata]|uniref:BAG family molecular chaperone regulator 4 n=1 Tax=Turnera subulata TaxID=218843 RepID=A0A9Q0FU79_9ROSI|nr:hypothetical protein Tsubulata_027925 [Turnera subulata]
MKNSSSGREQQLDCELRPGGMLVQRRDDDGHDHHHHQHGGPLIKINAAHGPAQHELHVPAQSTFGHVKKIVEEKTGLDPKQQKILFRGQEKEDEEFLHEAGVKDNSKVLVLEEPLRKEEEAKEIKESEGTSNLEEKLEAEVKVNDTEEMKKAIGAVAQIRAEVDKLAERVGALDVAVNGGTKVSEDEFVVSSELLMRQLLKLDGIEAEGEARLQRKAEVRRVQNFLESLDNLKARNAKPFSNSSNAVAVTTEWETFDSGVGSLNPPPPMPSSTRITEDWERFD